MPLYEHVFLCRHDVSQQQVETLTEGFRKIIEDNGGKLGKTEYWGLKPLIYKIKKNRKAHYSLLNIDAPHPAVAEMERQMSLSTDILRFLTLKVDELDEQPSAMMRPDKDDRRGGRRGSGGRPDRGGDSRGGDRGGDRGPRDRGGDRGGYNRSEKKPESPDSAPQAAAPEATTPEATNSAPTDA